MGRPTPPPFGTGVDAPPDAAAYFGAAVSQRGLARYWTGLQRGVQSQGNASWQALDHVPAGYRPWADPPHASLARATAAGLLLALRCGLSALQPVVPLARETLSVASLSPRVIETTNSICHCELNYFELQAGYAFQLRADQGGALMAPCVGH